MCAENERVVVASSMAPANIVEKLASAAARAPSIHNTRPWRFRVTSDPIELYADQTRWLRYVDPDQRELLISCGAALFGLRSGYTGSATAPSPNWCPTARVPGLLARVRLGPRSPFGITERTMWSATRGVPRFRFRPTRLHRP
jgi:nitroreductase